VRAVIDASIAMGQVVCISDPEEAARRNEAYLSGQVPPLPPFPGLTDGLSCGEERYATYGAAGLLSVHGRVRNEGEEMRYDDAIPNGFHVIAIDADPQQHLDAMSKAALARIGAQIVGITGDAGRMVPGRVLFDVSGKYRRFFDEHGVKAIMVRPDFYVFGPVKALSALPVLVANLRHDSPSSIQPRAKIR
jgi:hypothetical protein